MKHSVPSVNKEQNIRVIFDDVPDSGGQDIIIGDFIDWQPIYDLYIIEDDLVVTFEIAGVDIKDFSIYVKRIYMVINGIRKSPGILNREYCIFHNLEIPYGRFSRRIDFPVPIEPRRYQYKIENGILTIKFPILKEKVIPIEEG